MGSEETKKHPKTHLQLNPNWAQLQLVSCTLFPYQCQYILFLFNFINYLFLFLFLIVIRFAEGEKQWP